MNSNHIVANNKIIPSMFEDFPQSSKENNQDEEDWTISSNCDYQSDIFKE